MLVRLTTGVLKEYIVSGKNPQQIPIFVSLFVCEKSKIGINKKYNFGTLPNMQLEFKKILSKIFEFLGQLELYFIKLNKDKLNEFKLNLLLKCMITPLPPPKKIADAM